MSSTFDLLADPTRRRILEELGNGECAVGTLVERLAMSQPAVSKQLRILRDAELAVVRRDGQRRIYRLEAKRLREVDAWLARFRDYWEPRLDALEETLDSLED